MALDVKQQQLENQLASYALRAQNAEYARQTAGDKFELATKVADWRHEQTVRKRPEGTKMGFAFRRSLYLRQVEATLNNEGLKEDGPDYWKRRSELLAEIPAGYRY
jgi:hypothetical protein